MADGIIGSVGVSVVPDAENFWRRFEADTRAGGDNAGRRAGADWRRGFDEATRGLRVRPELDDAALRARLAALRAEMDRTMNGGARSGGGLLKAILPLAPALIPVAGAALAAGGALASMGVAGVLALKGIQAEMKSGSALGVQYATQIKIATNSLSVLEKTAATNFLGGFQGAVSKLTQTLPGFNNTVGSSSKILGDIASHLAGGLAAGFTTFQPMILSVERSIDSLAGRFEKFASSPAGAKFAANLVADFHQVGKFIGAAAGAITHLIVAAAPVGSVLVGAFTQLAQAISAIPVGALTAIITAMSALGTARLIGRLGPALAGIGEGATGAGRGLGTVALGLSRVVPYVAAAVGLHIAFKTAANATEDWATSTSTAKYALHETVKAADQLFSLDFTGFWHTLTSSSDDTTRNLAINFRSALTDAKNLAVNGRKDSNDFSTAWFQNGKLVFGTLDTLTGKFADLTHQQQQHLEQTRVYAAASAKLDAQIGSFRGGTRGASVTNLAPMYVQEASALDQLNQKNLKQITTGKTVAETYRGVKISQEAVVAVMSKYGMNVDVALGFLQGQVDAELKGAAASDAFAAKAQLLDSVISGAESTFKLTAAQVDLYSQAMGISGYQVANGTIVQQQFNMMIDQAKTAIDNGGVSINNWVAAIAQFNSAGDSAASRAALMGAAMVALQGDTLGYANTMVQAATANQKLITDFNATAAGVINLKTGFIDYHNAGAAPVLADLQQLQTAAMNAATATYQHEVSTLGLKQASKDAADVFKNDTTNALVGQHKQLGITRQEAEKLATRYFHWPKNAKTLIGQLGGDKVQTTLSGILTQLKILNGFTASPTVNANTYDATSKLTALQQYIDNMHGKTIPISIASGAVGGTKVPQASGTWAAFGQKTIPPNTTFTVGEGASHTWEGGVSDAQGRVSIFSNAQSKAMGFQTPTRYAGGTGEHGGFTGTGGAGSGPGSSSTGSGSGGSGGGSASTNVTYIVDGHKYSTLKDAKNAATAAFKANMKLGVTIEKKGFSDWKSALKGTVSQARAAFNTILAEAKKLGISDKLASSLSRENKKLDNLVAARNKVRDELGSPPAKPTAYDKLTEALQNLKSEIATVRAAVTGSFDVTSAGANPVSGRISAGGIGAQSKQARTRIKQFYQGIIELGHEHLNGDYLRQLAEKGPDALPEVQALVGHKKIIAQLNRDQKSDAYYGQKLGTYIGKKEYGADVNAAQAQVTDLKHRLHTDNVNIQKKLEHLEARFTKAVNHLATRPVQVVAPNGKVLWEYVERGRKESGR